MVYGPGADMARYLARVEADKITPAAAEAAGRALADRMRAQRAHEPTRRCWCGKFHNGQPPVQRQEAE